MEYRNQIIQGNALEILRTMPSNYVQCCITSPPYYGLRNYQTETILQLEGDPQDCQHVWIHEGRNEDGAKVAQCQHCFAVKVDQQIGLEESPEAYIAKLVEVFDEVKRVLKDDGLLWLNIGDSYAGANWRGGTEGSASRKQLTNRGTVAFMGRKPHVPDGCKPKDLIGIPWMLAFALRADGWYLRSEIIWHKPNCMPESVKDRPTKSHEQIFLFAKSERYFYDAEAIKEPAISGQDLGILRGRTFVDGANVSWHADSIRKRQEAGIDSYTAGSGFRNKRSVWTVPTVAYSEAHFATFPPKLIEPCILAGSHPGDIVLDPFSGAGTTAYVASKLGRAYLGIELNPEYVEMSKQRLMQLSLVEAA